MTRRTCDSIARVALPMTASTVRSRAEAAGLELPEDVLIVLDENPELVGRGLAGHTWPDGARITLYPDAFESEEQLLRTIVHELVHVRQVRLAGAPVDTLELVLREREAYAEEEAWWHSHREQR
jgi:hypothetical protein